MVPSQSPFCRLPYRLRLTLPSPFASDFVVAIYLNCEAKITYILYRGYLAV